LADRPSGSQFILVGKNHVIAFCEAIDGFREIERPKPNLDSARMHDAVFHGQGGEADTRKEELKEYLQKEK